MNEQRPPMIQTVTPKSAPRLIRRREVLAFIALTGDEANMPNLVDIREYMNSDKEWHTIDLDVDTEPAVRFWMAAFGHPADRLKSWDRETHTSYRSQDEGNWRGWTTIVSARVPKSVPAGEALDEATTTALTALAAPEAVSG